MKKITAFIGIGIGLVLAFFIPASFAADTPEGYYRYIIQEGDNLHKIAPEKSWDTIMRVNHIDAQHLQVGREILIPINHENIPAFCPVPQEIDSDVKKLPRVIYVFLEAQYFGAYEFGQLKFWGPLSSGKKNHATPTGKFKIMQKAKNYFSHNKAYYGTPMPYALRITNDGIFLHQQALPGKPASHGCIRLLMSDAKKLFYWVSIDDQVVILP